MSPALKHYSKVLQFNDVTVFHAALVGLGPTLEYVLVLMNGVVLSHTVHSQTSSGNARRARFLYC